MKSPVYFIKVRNGETPVSVQKKVAFLLEKSSLFDFVSPKDDAVIKLHFGEEGNKGFVKPEYVKVICDQLRKLQARPVLVDTNTLYKGRRTSSADHWALAQEHGFTKDATGVEVVIPDDSLEKNVATVEINQKHIRKAKVAKYFLQADALIGVAHFKGHLMTGFGGALKNIGMGCASREGKLAQHSDLAPFVAIEKCTGCAACVKVCPVNAIALKNKKSFIDGKKCIGCATCIAVCPVFAIEINWGSGGDTIQEKMVEYTKAILDSKKGKCAFLNFALKITKECDCLAQDDPRIVEDVGVLASTDPVSLDKACYDLVNQRAGKDIFRKVHPERDGLQQLIYAQELGLGRLDYELVDVG